MNTSTYDYVLVGGGLAGCVLASRLREYDDTAKILLIEAGPDTRSRPDVINPRIFNMGGDLDWMYKTEPGTGVMPHAIIANAGKGLGGGSAINSCAWTRGSAVDFDEWGALVGDERFSYKGQLPWFKKSEHWLDASNPDQHGHDGPIHITSAKTAGCVYPLTEQTAAAWDELGVRALPGLDMNAGDNLGRGYYCQSKKNGQREWSAAVYPLQGVELRLNTTVNKLVVSKGSHDNDTPTATGVELADGTVVSAKNVIVCAGVYRSPQLLQLSGIGPASHLREVGVAPLVDLPDVGEGLSDHMMMVQSWRLRDQSVGYTIGSANPLFAQPQFEFARGGPADWIVSTTVPEDGLVQAIRKDEGAEPDASRHPLLARTRSFLEYATVYDHLLVPGHSFDGEHLTTVVVGLLPTSRGRTSLRSARPDDPPKIEMNYLATEVDRYVARQGVRQYARYMLGTKLSEVVAGESVPEGLGLEPVSLDMDDEKIDKRIAAMAGTTFHGAGTCSMGKVVDTEFRVRGVKGLRVVDASVIPVVLSAHIQAAVYALAEQAAAIISGKMDR